MAVNDDDGASSPTLPAGCGGDNTSDVNWFESVTAASNSITVKLVDPRPATSGTGNSAFLRLCRPDSEDVYSSIWSIRDTGATKLLGGTTHTITKQDTNNTGDALEPETDYWVQLRSTYASNSPWVYIRTTAASTPSITISGGSAVTEGMAATFTLTASSAPSANLAVTVKVYDAPNSDFVAAADEGDRTVTLPIGSTTVNFTVETQSDSTDEPSSHVGVTVKGGTGYSLDVGSSFSAKVAVNDDDGASSPTLPAGCGADETSDVNWFESVTATSNSITVKLVDPRPATNSTGPSAFTLPMSSRQR